MGPDGIHPRLLRELVKVTAIPFSIIFQCLEVGKKMFQFSRRQEGRLVAGHYQFPGASSL